MSRTPPLPPRALRPALALCLAVALSLPAPARTTEAAPALLDREAFEARAAERAPRAGISYPYARCAALYRALRLFARPESGAVDEALRRPTAGERALIDEAVRARVEQTGMRRAGAGPQTENDVAGNTGFARDIPQMAEELGTEPLLIVAREVSPPEQGVTPLPVDTAGIPNDHLEYAITWFSLAAIWAAMTGAFIWRGGRAAKGTGR